MTQETPINRVALVYMPWGSISRPSIAAGILKRCAAEAGFPADVHYLNLRFARLVGLQLYESTSNCSAFYPEWFFSTHLFGPAGLGLVENSLSQLQATAEGREMAAEVARVTGNSQNCQRVADAVPAFIEECLTRIDWSVYRVVGFSVTFAQTLASLLLARRLKEKYPKLSIVFGGANVDAEMGVELLRGCDWIDYVVHGEAEHAFPRLLREICGSEPPNPVAGVSGRRNGSVECRHRTAEPLADLNQSPAPDYGEYFRDAERLGIDKQFNIVLPFESSRGCWWGAKKHCTFCGLNGGTMAFRSKDPHRVYEELLDLSRRHRCLNLNAVDNILDMHYFKNLLPRLAEADADISLFYEVKANLTREQVRDMAAAGITRIQPGIESLSSELLRLMRKGVTALQNIQLLKWCFEYGIEPSWNILFGFPDEQPVYYEGYAQLMRRLTHLTPPEGLSSIIFERFSPYHFERSQFKLRLSPLSKYRFLYPESVFNFADLAYYFEGKWEGQSEDHFSYVPELEAAFEEWRGLWRSTKPVFHFERGPGFLILHDSRPEQPGAEPRLRRLKLNEIQSEIYLYCDQGRALSSICAMLSQRFPGAMPESQIEGLLNEFVERRLMYREGNRFLSLAVRKHPRPMQYGTGVVRPQTVEAALVPAPSGGARLNVLQ
ncbi:MAG: RiPP maturation radical SAM C-methyltransferase [Acidobacteriaceae bacterium]|nr:RiPP maturation radical SAM C-methyltransferase [Acidobacteriaceae bacterium]